MAERAFVARSQKARYLLVAGLGLAMVAGSAYPVYALTSRQSASATYFYGYALRGTERLHGQRAQFETEGMAALILKKVVSGSSIDMQTIASLHSPLGLVSLSLSTANGTTSLTGVSLAANGLHLRFSSVGRPIAITGSGVRPIGTLMVDQPAQLFLNVEVDPLSQAHGSAAGPSQVEFSVKDTPLSGRMTWSPSMAVPTAIAVSWAQEEITCHLSSRIPFGVASTR